MKINMTVSNEHHVQMVSSVVHNMVDSAFNDVTLVCSDGQLRVNGLTLALLLPPPYRTLHLGEGALLLLPQHKVQEMCPMGGIKLQENQTRKDHDDTFNEMNDSFDKDSDRDKKEESRRTCIPKEEHLPKQELAKVRAKVRARQPQLRYWTTQHNLLQHISTIHWVTQTH